MKKYTALRTIGSILKILGIINGVITILLSLGSCLFFGFIGSQISSVMYRISGTGGDIGGTIITGVITGLTILIYGGISALMIYGVGELIFLMIDMEHNTRETTELLRISSGEKPTY
jgi:ABC-type transport system involved in multi-copper enzyme maturation permease subunit